MRKSRILALFLAVAICVSMGSVAMAEEITMDGAKASLARVAVSQTCCGGTHSASDPHNIVHDFSTNGTAANIRYTATLQMTEDMAIYLQARQKQLVGAEFSINIYIDADVLEFASTDSAVTATLTSTFLKPVSNSDFTCSLVSSADGEFKHSISVDKTWALNTIKTNGYIAVPAELIVYFDGQKAYGADELPASAKSEPSLFAGFTVDNWRKETKLEGPQMKVKSTVASTVTSADTTWKTVKAHGTVDGEFSYEKSMEIVTIGDYDYANNQERLEFGNGTTIEEWSSNEVQILFKGQLPTPSGGGSGGGGGTIVVPGSDTPSALNTEDHFAYVIGYPDGTVRPQGSITRAEVATIFFRMLKDEVRSQNWSQESGYSDVTAGNWFNNAISTLSKLGILNGYADGTFKPNANITRAEFAAMIVRFFSSENAENLQSDFTDIDTHWAKSSIDLAYTLGLVSGYPDSTFKPQNDITRAEAMTLVNNTLRRTPTVEGVSAMEQAEGYIAWSDNADKNAWFWAEVQEATNSHDYTVTNSEETWTAVLPVRDWAAFEKAWSDANAAENPGEVNSGT